MKGPIVLSAFLLCVAAQLHAQSELKTKSISIFKNGKAFMVKEGTVPATDKVYTLKTIPNALYGTLWFSGLPSDISQVTSKQEIVTDPLERKAYSFTDMLFANKGKQVTVATTDNNTYSGIVEDFDLPEEINNALQLKETELSETYGAEYSAGYRILPPSQQTLLLKMNNKWISINPLNIQSIEFSEKPQQKVQTTIKVKKPVIKIQFMQGGNQKLKMMYLQNGFSWTPVYSLELLSDTEARLKLQAEVANDAEDINNTDVNFVVGVPNFKFAANPATLTSFAQRMTRELYSNRDYFSNTLVPSQMLDSKAIAEISTEEANMPMENVDANASEDLYFYTIKNVDLEKGGRAYYPLLNTTIKIKHLYECVLPASSNNYYNNDENDENGYSFNTKYSNVFHTIEIKNDTKNPFTTGPVLITQSESQKPLAQDLIKYTGKGLSSSIQLTQSPDIRVEEKEKIISTVKEARKKDGYTYSLVTVQGEVIIANSKAKDIELAISKNITGKFQSATVTHNISSKVNRNDMNPATAIKFSTNVKASEKKNFTYTYQVYVRQ